MTFVTECARARDKSHVIFGHPEENLYTMFAMVFETLTLVTRYHSRSLTLLLLCASLIGTACGQCTVCQGAQQVPLPEKILAIPGFPALPCEAVDSTLAFLVPNESSTECEVVQSLGSICGCPTRDDGCSLCSKRVTPGFAEKQLPDFMSAFYLSWTCLLAATLIASPSLREDPNLDRFYPLFVTALFLAPLQGFWNATVYFRPRLLSRWSKFTRQRKILSPEGAPPNAGSSLGSGTTANSSCKLPRRISNDRVGARNDDTVVGETAIGNTRGEDFDPSNEIAFLTTRISEHNTDTADDAISGYPSADLDAIREELEELEGVQAQIEDPPDGSQ